MKSLIFRRSCSHRDSLLSQRRAGVGQYFGGSLAILIGLIALSPVNPASAQLVPAAGSVPTQVAAGFATTFVSEDVVVNCDMLLWDSTTRDKIKVIAYSKRNFPVAAPSASVFVEDWGGNNLTISLPTGSSRADVALADGVTAFLPIQPGVNPEYRVVIAYQIQMNAFLDVWTLQNVGTPSMIATHASTIWLNSLTPGNYVDTFHNGPHIDMWSDETNRNSKDNNPTMHQFAVVWTEGPIISSGLPPPNAPTKIGADELMLYTEDLNFPGSGVFNYLGNDAYCPDVACITDIFTRDQFVEIAFTNTAHNSLEEVQFNYTLPVTPISATRSTATVIDASATYMFPRIEAESYYWGTGTDRWCIVVSKGPFTAAPPTIGFVFQVYSYFSPGPGTNLSLAFPADDVKSPCVAAGTAITPSGSFFMGTAIYADSYLMGFFPRTGPDVFVRAKNVGTLATMYPQWWQVNSSPVNYNWDAARSFHISTTSNNGLDFLAAWYDGNSVVYKTTLNNTTPMFRTLKIPTSSNVAVVPYPNPATNQIVLKGAESQEYKLRDMTGRIFGNGTITTNGEISLASLSVGTYTLQVNFKDGNNQVFKIQKL